MEQENKDFFISEQVNLLMADITETDVMRNVRIEVFNNAEPNESLDTLIDRCMEIYCEIIAAYNFW